jgi:high-affinity iron transporter
VIGNFIIGLREGLEAAIVVGILAAYLVKAGRSEQRRWLAFGVLAAIGSSLSLGAALTFTSRSLSETAEETFGGVASILAVALVTWMVFWMRRTARELPGQLHGQAERALSTGSAALALVGFVAVGREGLETALFLWSATQATGTTTASLLGALAGLVCAAAAGRLFYRGALRLDLARFFRWSGTALIVVAAGVLSYGVHELQEAEIAPGEHALAFDVTGAVPAGSWYAALLKGTIGFTPETSWAQLLVWLAYLVPVLVAYLWPARAVSPAPVTSLAAGRS